VDLFEVFHSDAVRRFQNRTMDGKELLAFELFFTRLRREPGGEGRKEFSHHGPHRILHFSYYVSTKLRTLFVLMAYQERRGEPRSDDLKAEQELMTVILQQESDHEDVAEEP
jgi:hypothetical protein